MLVQRTDSLEVKTPRGWNIAAYGLTVLLVAALAGFLPAPPRAFAAGEKAPAKKAAPNRLSYNDGKEDGKRSIGGSGELISFTLPDEGAKVAGIRIHGSRYGYPQPPKENFIIYFLNQDLSETVATESAPYSRFQRGDQKWVEIKFKKPVEVPKEFWVCLDFRAAQTKGVYVSTDSSSDGSRSRVGLPGSESKPANIEGDWMVEVVLAR